MNSKINLKEKIEFALSNHEMSNEVRELVISLKESLEKDLDENQKWQLYLKWITIFKDASQLILTSQKFLE